MGSLCFHCEKMIAAVPAYKKLKPSELSSQLSDPTERSVFETWRQGTVNQLKVSGGKHYFLCGKAAQAFVQIVDQTFNRSSKRGKEYTVGKLKIW